MRLQAIDLCCLQILQRFFHSCRKGKGGQLVEGVPWIRVTAEDMVGYLLRDGLEVGYKTVQRSLARLANAGRVQRKQRFLFRYDRRMRFSPSDTDQKLHEMRPTTVARAASSSVPSDRHQSTSRKDTTGLLSKESLDKRGLSGGS
jgi:hypothetical protein